MCGGELSFNVLSTRESQRHSFDFVSVLVTTHNEANITLRLNVIYIEMEESLIQQVLAPMFPFMGFERLFCLNMVTQQLY